MHVEKLFLSVIICVMCLIVESNGTDDLTRVTRSLPFDLSPSRLSEIFQTLWSGGRFWDWPRSKSASLLRLVASPDTRKKMIFEFRPEDGPRASFEYQRRHGYRGQWLIELLGSGYHPDSLSHFHRQPLPAFVLTPPPL